MNNIDWGLLTVLLVVLSLIGLKLLNMYVPITYDRTWDKQLNALLDKHRFKNIRQCTATLGGVEIWIENRPYKDMRIYNTDLRPSFFTLLRARRRLVEDLVAEAQARAQEQEPQG